MPGFSSSASRSPRRRILLTAVGSLGDLHPYLALAQELERRGYQATVAAMPALQQRVEAAGVRFRPVRAATQQELSPELIRRIFAGRRGVEYIIRQLLMPALREGYEDLSAAAAEADLVVSHPLSFAARFAAETRGLPWVSTQLAPIGLLSVTDPPVLPGLEWLRRLPLGARGWRTVFRVGDRQTRPWLRPVDDLCVQLGLGDRGNPLFAGSHAPTLDLALFSPHFAAPQPDWPAQTVATGFPFFAPARPLDAALERWLDAGPPPVVFTLGSSAVWAPGAFFRESAAAARRLGRRALLLGARQERLRELQGSDAALADDGAVMTAGYADYGRIFPRAAAIVHQGGIGTTAEALRSGRPFLVVPFGTDQPDNAARALRLGVARRLSLRRYRERRVAAELHKLLTAPRYAAAAAQIAPLIRAENGAAAACDVLQPLLA